MNREKLGKTKSKKKGQLPLQAQGYLYIGEFFFLEKRGQVYASNFKVEILSLWRKILVFVSNYGSFAGMRNHGCTTREIEKKNLNIPTRLRVCVIFDIVPNTTACICKFYDPANRDAKFFCIILITNKVLIIWQIFFTIIIYDELLSENWETLTLKNYFKR